MAQTTIQKQIEQLVTGGSGCDRRIGYNLPWEIRETELGLQAALATMDMKDRKILDIDVCLFFYEISALVEKLKEAGTPLETITSPEEMTAAIDSLYEEIRMKLLDFRRGYYKQETKPRYERIEIIPIECLKRKLPKLNKLTGIETSEYQFKF